MPFPSLFEEPARPEPEIEGGLLGEGMFVGPRPVSPGRERRLAAAAAASGTAHAFVLVLLVVLMTRALPSPEPPVKPVEMTFVQPPPLVAPPPSARQRPAARPRPSAPEPKPAPVPPPAMSPSLTKPQLVPLVPLPQPNRMGEQVPIPPPPKVTRETPPPEEQEALPDAQQGPKASAPAQAGTPEGTGQALPEGDPGAGAAAHSGGAAPEGERVGRLPVPGGSGQPGLGQPGPGGEGSRFPGSGVKPPRRGIKLGVPFDTGVYQNFTPEHQDFDWTDYWPQMYQLILHAWYNRLLATASLFERAAYERGDAGLEGQATLQFTIERSGNVSRAVIIRPSGIEPLDDSARDALREVILPRLPANFPYERENVTGIFRMDVGDVRAMHADLAAMKSQRLF